MRKAFCRAAGGGSPPSTPPASTPPAPTLPLAEGYAVLAAMKSCPDFARTCKCGGGGPVCRRDLRPTDVVRCAACLGMPLTIEIDP